MGGQIKSSFGGGDEDEDEDDSCALWLPLYFVHVMDILFLLFNLGKK